MPDQDLIRVREWEQRPTLRELAMVLFRRKRVFVCVSGGVIAAAILYAIFGTQYEANMQVLVRRGRANAPVSVEQDAPVDLTRLDITEEELNSEAELLRDDEVLHTVVQETGLGENDWLHFLRRGEGNAQRVERAARGLAKKLKVEPIKKTNLLAVRYASDDPQMAAKVLQSVEKTYLEKHMEVHRPNGEYRFFELQTSEALRQLEQSKQKLLSFAGSRGVVAAGEQRDLALQKLSEVDANYRQTRIQLTETQQRVWELEAQLQKLPQRETTVVRTADNPELLKALKSTLLDLQLRRTSLLTKFEPTHRLVREVDEQIAQAELAVAKESALPVKDESTDKNTQYEWARSELQKAQVDFISLQAREAAIVNQEVAYQTMARHLGEDAITQDDLLSSEKAAQENYLLYVKKQEQARMDDALDERGIVNVAIARHPVVPALPVWSTWGVLAIGFLAAGVAGTGASFTADYLDPAFRTPDDVLAYLNSPVLASLPERSSGRLPA
ncbi:MAG TPA: Wzz/FepE/Etk N-terminal domain-containing protein [Candidatus Sulfotelmatobacter sp.]|nr:Wzz/FepE/Etk N-terminal domain-containing protein [Candidatus Sulfotelmatobacter sp.]